MVVESPGEVLECDNCHVFFPDEDGWAAEAGTDMGDGGRAFGKSVCGFHISQTAFQISNCGNSDVTT